MRKIVAPLALLASISLLTSCTKKEEVPVVPTATTETPAPVMEDTPAAPVTPAPEATVAPTSSPESLADTGTTTPEAAAPAPVAATPLTRTETVSYKFPEGVDLIEFSVTVDNGVITAASATPKAEHPVSKQFQENFSAKLSENVVGKNAKGLDVAAIGGASLATTAFEMYVQSF